MKNRTTLLHCISLITFVFLMFLAVGSSSEGTNNSNTSFQWVQGGNLHKATVAEWKRATNANKLATAADFLAASLWSENLNSPDDFARLKVKAQDLVNGINYVVAGGDHANNVKVNEIAGILIAESGNDLGP